MKTTLFLLLFVLQTFAALDRVVLIVDKTGKPITFIDEAEWGKSVDQILSTTMLKEFVCVELPREKIPAIKEWMQPVGLTYSDKPMEQPVRTVDYRERAAVCDISKLATEAKMPTLTTAAASKTTVKPIVDATKLDETKYMVDSKTSEPIKPTAEVEVRK
jgi:hypothetical protein